MHGYQDDFAPDRRLRAAPPGAPPAGGESFTEVVLRAEWPDRGVTARELRALYETEGPIFDDEALDRIGEAKSHDQPPKDKWGEG